MIVKVGGELDLELEEIVSSGCRRKIICYLSDYGATYVMALILGIRGKYSQTNAELQRLEREGIIVDSRVGRMREIRLNKENPKTRIILQALKTLHSKYETNDPKTKADCPN